MQTQLTLRRHVHDVNFSPEDAEGPPVINPSSLKCERLGKGFVSFISNPAQCKVPFLPLPPSRAVSHISDSAERNVASVEHLKAYLHCSTGWVLSGWLAMDTSRLSLWLFQAHGLPLFLHIYFCRPSFLCHFKRHWIHKYQTW